MPKTTRNLNCLVRCIGIRGPREAAKTARKNFQQYKPIISALKNSDCPLYAKEISGYTGRSLRTEKKYLGYLWEAGLIGMTGDNSYYLDKGHREELQQTFGVRI